MDLHERIERRQNTARESGLIVDRTPLNPAVHLPEPVGRGPVLERLLDVLDPVFRQQLPDDVAVFGPKGSGKSALVSALFAGLNDQIGRDRQRIGTTTRAGSAEGTTQFVRIDATNARSEFRFYHTLLTAVVDESVPERGVGTDTLRERLADQLQVPTRCAVVAVDHLTDVEDVSVTDLLEWFEPVDDAVTVVPIGHEVPETWTGETVHVPEYRQHALVDILTTRASQALESGALRHGQARRIAEWAGGDAHDALAATFGAADTADRAGADRIRANDVDAGIDAVPENCVHLGRVLGLPENRQRVLSELLRLDGTPTIREAAAAIAEGSDLTASTVKRFLYELAENGVLERVQTTDAHGNGRTPSHVVPRFPTLVFRRLDGDL
ncbi:Cdc6/Cdc18 family protein [Halostella pelagica]|uniref:Cdc6/Cdc18 family protein n=1 Tax=Halostella pelagica TaxID=2583824 RepID=UPI0010803BC5|nr:AAA family ATPase [Halostella pelagica]